MADLFKGKKLMKKSGNNFVEVDVEKTLRGKVVALYFSAHWCGPCRHFTPILKKFYDALNGEPFEIVFLSSDKSEKEMNEYLKEVHGDWCFLPFEDPLTATLKGKFATDGIPTLSIITSTGEEINRDVFDEINRNLVTPQAFIADYKKKSGL